MTNGSKIENEPVDPLHDATGRVDVDFVLLVKSGEAFNNNEDECELWLDDVGRTLNDLDESYSYYVPRLKSVMKGAKLDPMHYAVRALALICPEDPELDHIINEALCHRDKVLRWHAILAIQDLIKRFGKSISCPALIVQLITKDPDSSVRDMALETLICGARRHDQQSQLCLQQMIVGKHLPWFDRLIVKLRLYRISREKVGPQKKL